MNPIRVLALVLFAQSLVMAEQPGTAPAATDAGALVSESARLRAVSSLLEEGHCLGQGARNGLASRFLDRYLDLLDPMRLLFLQTDVEEFSVYRGTLDRLARAGDLSPALQIYERFELRLQQENAFAQAFLATNTFKVDGENLRGVDRTGSERPRDLREAMELWAQHLGYEFLEKAQGSKSATDIVRTLSERSGRMISAAGSRDLVWDLYLNALASAYDPHSEFLDQIQAEQTSMALTLSLVGLGIQVEAGPRLDGYCKIQQVIPESPADRSHQIFCGDRVVAIAQDAEEQRDLKGVSIGELKALFKWRKGTKVRITLLPAESADGVTPRTVTLVCDEIRIEGNAATARVVDTLGPGGNSVRIGIVDLPSFYCGPLGEADDGHDATADVTRLLGQLSRAKISGLILDLRHNGGGSLDAAIRLTGLFISYGPVVQLKGRTQQVCVVEDPNWLTEFDGPLVVLTSPLTASGAEILAAALQDYDRALIIGNHSTFGKGTVQALIDLAPYVEQGGGAEPMNCGTLQLTVAKFYRPDGGSIQLRGVTPDINLPVISGIKGFCEGGLLNPLEWDSVPTVKHRRLNRVTPYLHELRRREAMRLAVDPNLACGTEKIRCDAQPIRSRESEGTGRPAADVALEETQRILLDYIDMIEPISGGGACQAGRPLIP